MRAIILLASLVLASCGPRTLELPDNPIDRAATCGAVAASRARVATNNINAKLSLEAIGSVLHYPMLGGIEGDSFSSAKATRVQERMAELQDKIGEGKWEDLIPACRAAYPAAAIETVELPENRFEAQLGCDELGDFLRSALRGQDEYINELGEYRALGAELETPLTVGLRSRTGGDTARVQEERRKALATMARAGPPVAVMRQCLDRFGEE